MGRRRSLLMGVALLGAITSLLVLSRAAERVAEAQGKSAAQAPRFEVDPFWPKPLPNHWLLGSTIGVDVDAQDHVFIIHRGDSTLNQRTEVGADAKPPIGECCRSAPP